jgi:hypothetical protein
MLLWESFPLYIPHIDCDQVTKAIPLEVFPIYRRYKNYNSTNTTANSSMIFPGKNYSFNNRIFLPVVPY